jgi:hypothetical protein
LNKQEGSSSLGIYLRRFLLAYQESSFDGLITLYDRIVLYQQQYQPDTCSSHQGSNRPSSSIETTVVKSSSTNGSDGIHRRDDECFLFARSSEQLHAFVQTQALKLQSMVYCDLNNLYPLFDWHEQLRIDL